MVLGRVASNYVQARARGSSKKKDSEGSSSKAVSAQSKAIHVRSTVRDRRARLTKEGRKAKLQRAKDSKKRAAHVHVPVPVPHSQASVTADALRPSIDPAPSTSPPHIEPEEHQDDVSAEDIEMPEEENVRAEEPPEFQVLQLPRRLLKPRLREPSAEQLSAVGLGDMPLPFVREMVEEVGSGNRFFKSLARSNIIHSFGAHASDSRLPAYAIVERSESATLEPSHALALHSGTRNIVLQLCHAMVLAAHCSNLPVMPPPCPDDGFVWHNDARGRFGRYKIPVVPLYVPSVELFSTLVAYLCTLNEHHLVAALVGVTPLPAVPEPVQLPSPDPSPPRSNDAATNVNHLTNEVHRLSVLLAMLHVKDFKAIRFKARRVWNLHLNAVALGVNEEGLWSAMQTAWSALLLAMHIMSHADELRVATN